MKQTYFHLLFFIFILFTCKNKDINPNPSTLPANSTITGTILGVNTVSGIINNDNSKITITYSTTNFSIFDEDVFISTSPLLSISGDYFLSLKIVPEPVNVNYEIDKNGVITIKNLTVGTYKVWLLNNGLQTNTLLNLTVNPSLPKELYYLEQSILLKQGNGYQTSLPTLKGTGPFVFEIKNNPNSAITIDKNNGILSISSTSPIGSYSIDVSVNNVAGNQIFTSAITLTVTSNSFPPSELIYDIVNTQIYQGHLFASDLPTTDGSAPYWYTLTSNPNTNAVQVNAANGIVSTTSNLLLGQYSFSISVSNEAGTFTLNNAIQLEVLAPVLPRSLMYSSPYAIVKSGDSFKSSLPSIGGTAPFTYSIPSTLNEMGISINSNNGELLIAPTATLGNYLVDITVSNEAGSSVFLNAFEVDIFEEPVTYLIDINPIISLHCNSCHSGWASDYAGTSLKVGPPSSINSILNRINRPYGDSYKMPKSGDLTQNQKDLILKWYNTGLKP